MMRLGLAAALALSGSVLLHGAGLFALSGPSAEPLAAGGHSAPPLLGDSFADLAQGMAQPVAAVPVAPRATAPIKAKAAPSPAALAFAPPDAAAPAPDGIEGLIPLAAPMLVPTEPQHLTPAPSTLRPRPAPQNRAVATVQPQALPPRPEPQAKPAKPPTAQGGAQAALKGTTTGSASGTSARAQGAQQAQGDGGAAATARYGSTVMRKIASTRKISTRRRGTAVISFQIGPGGQLASVSVARSSGHAELDQLGLDHIRRAAPFPPPPDGGTARFSVEFQGR